MATRWSKGSGREVSGSSWRGSWFLGSKEELRGGGGGRASSLSYCLWDRGRARGHQKWGSGRGWGHMGRNRGPRRNCSLSGGDRSWWGCRSLQSWCHTGRNRSHQGMERGWGRSHRGRERDWGRGWGHKGNGGGWSRSCRRGCGLWGRERGWGRGRDHRGSGGGRTHRGGWGL